MITYNSIGVTHPPLDKKILVKKANYTFDDNATVTVMESAMWGSEEEAAMYLLTEGFELWAQV